MALRARSCDVCHRITGASPFAVPSAGLTTRLRQHLAQKAYNERYPERVKTPAPAPEIPVPTPGPVPPTRDDLLADPGLQAALSSHAIASADAALSTSASRVAVAQALRRATGAPIAAHVYLAMGSAADAVDWYARHCAVLRPPMPAAHAVRLTAGVSGRTADAVEHDVVRSGGLVVGPVLEEGALPPNLALDPVTFHPRARKRTTTSSTRYRAPHSRVAAARREIRRASELDALKEAA